MTRKTEGERETEVGGGVTEIEALKYELGESEKKKNEYLAIAQRLQADFENYRKRNADIIPRVREEALTEVIESILPVLDNLYLAVASIKDETNLRGINLIIRQFNDILGSYGITEIDALDKEFNPEFHNCITRCEAQKGKAAGIVAAVHKKGYILNNTRVIRASDVTVAG